MIKELVFNIDMINGFVKKGALAAPSIMRIVPRQLEILEEAKKDPEVEIVDVRDLHTLKSVELKTFGIHGLEGTDEVEQIDELKGYADRVFYKNCTNLIFAPGIQEYLKGNPNLKRVRLMGCLSEICVTNGGIGLRTFFDQNNMDVEVCVHADAIDTYDAPGHNADQVTEQALKMMEANGIKVLRKER